MSELFGTCVSCSKEYKLSEIDLIDYCSNCNKFMNNSTTKHEQFYLFVEDFILINLKKGQILIDKEDYERVSQYKWYIFNGTGDIKYAQCGSKKVNRRLHRFIMNDPEGYIVDHKDRNGLDNRKLNLRVTIYRNNRGNAIKSRSNTSGYKGVVWDKQNKKWKAHLNLTERYHNLGLFDNKEEAARMYDSKAIEIFGEYSRLNFPDSTEQSLLFSKTVCQ